MSEFNGDADRTVKVEYDEDENVEVKYEPFDSTLESNDVRDPVQGPQTTSSKINSGSGIHESEILRYDSGCLTCQNVVMKITGHVTSNLCPIVNNGTRGSGQTEPPEYIVDESSLIKIEPEDDFVKSEPPDDTNETEEPGIHNSVNSGQKQCKVLDFDTGLCKPGCELCEKCVQELRNHLKRNHHQLQCQPRDDSDTIDLVTESNERSTEKSRVLGPLKTIDCASAEAYRFRHFRRLRKPDGEKNTGGSKDAHIKKRTTQTSKRAGYPAEDNVSQPGSSKPGKKKSRLNSNQSDQNKNKVVKRRTGRLYGENSDSESKSKESESEGRSANAIQTGVESSELNLTSAVTLGEKVDSSDSHEINLTEHVPHTGGKQNITHTGDDFAERTTVGGESVKIIHSGGDPKMDRSGEKLDKPTDTGEKETVTVSRSRNASPIGEELDEMSHTEEKTKKLAGEQGKTVQSVRSDQLSRDIVIPSQEKEFVRCNCVFCESSFRKSTEQKSSHKDFRCDECGINFSSSDRLSVHKTHHELGTLHTCDDCGKGFETLKWLTTHKETHMPNYPLKCDNYNCTMRFKTQSDLITHLLMHGGDKLLRCDVCGMRFKQLPNLVTHMMIHLDQNPFRCDICEERFKTPQELDTHIVIHIGAKENLHTCLFCGKTFKRLAQLTSHKVIHSEKPFKCYICKESFKILAQLTHHIGIHSEWKPYNCEVCEKSFKSYDAVFNHMVIHTEERPFKCHTCEKDFKKSYQLTTHMERYH